MAPRPAPDLDQRRDEVVRTARALAESEGWSAVTVRRLSTELGVSPPVLYSAFADRQAIVDATALEGFGGLATELDAVEATPRARIGAYLAFAAAHPQIYTAMFSMPSGLAFASHDIPEPLTRAFAAIGAAFPGAADTWLEIAWSVLHGLATLQAGGRLTPGREQARLDLVHQLLTQQFGSAGSPTATAGTSTPQPTRSPTRRSTAR